MFNLSIRNIQEHIKKLTKEDIVNFAQKYNVYLKNDELEFIYSFIKNNNQEILNNPKNFNLNLYKDKFTNENFNKISSLYTKYSGYLSLIHLTD